MTLRLLALFACSLLAAAPPAPEPILKKGARVAVVGDSITEQKLYSRYIELYLLACVPELDLKVIQLGWGGETAGGFVNRMNNDLLPWKPDLVTTCYGMNDGGYKAFDQNVGKWYSGQTTEIVKRCKAAGATVIVGSPGAVDTKYFKNAKVYNPTLNEMRTVAKQVAADTGAIFASVHDPMMQGMEKAKAALGEDYDVCGRDGVHPGPNGHLIMAYAFLKAMGLDGRIGTVTMDMAGTATTTEGHKVVAMDKGKVDLESARWPFCFQGDDKTPNGTRSILPYVPFCEDLNRFTLVVRGLSADKAKVTWGRMTRSFSKADLEAGINLAREFADNPFVEPFRKLDGLVFAKQDYETTLIKQTINSFPRLIQLSGKDPELTASVEALRTQAFATHEKMHAAARAAVVPVAHSIVVVPE